MASRCLNQPTTPPAIPLTRSLIKLKYHIVTVSPAPRSSQTLLYFRTTCSPLSLSFSLHPNCTPFSRDSWNRLRNREFRGRTARLFHGRIHRGRKKRLGRANIGVASDYTGTHAAIRHAKGQTRRLPSEQPAFNFLRRVVISSSPGSFISRFIPTRAE